MLSKRSAVEFFLIFRALFFLFSVMLSLPFHLAEALIKKRRYLALAA